MNKKLDGSVMLPEKYEMLGKFFDSLDSSIRLLRLKGSTCTFTNISPKVECLTDRRFSYAHLAKLKFILPEVIEMKKVLVRDERTSCMKPDLHIAMNFDAIKSERKLKSTSGNSHMRKVFHARLLGFFKDHPEGEVPEETLPEPFNKSRLDLHTNTSNASSSSLIAETLTPAKLVSTPVKLTSTTPTQHLEKRGYMTPDSSTSSGSKLTRRPLRNKSLQFDSPVKNTVLEREINDIGGVPVDNDINLLQSNREKERKALEEKGPAISQAKRRQKMIASLPKLFDMVRFLFQSINRSVVTKEEFMHQLVANHLDIVDRGELEDQVKLLQELVPGWIFEKLAASGDRLICINRMSSLDSMRARIVEAK